jgi:nucleoside-diphosphate-sugar epimerase
VLDASLARKHLGWSAAMPLAEGLRRTYDWMRK